MCVITKRALWCNHGKQAAEHVVEHVYMSSMTLSDEVADASRLECPHANRPGVSIKGSWCMRWFNEGNKVERNEVYRTIMTSLIRAVPALLVFSSSYSSVSFPSFSFVYNFYVLFCLFSPTLPLCILLPAAHSIKRGREKQSKWSVGLHHQPRQTRPSIYTLRHLCNTLRIYSHMG